LKTNNEVSFLVIGDWGGLPVYPFRTLIEEAVSKTMNSIAQQYDTKFQLALGDNFYFNGVNNLDDKRFHVIYI
jgi:tartrate-resistant acid phosphatase type 5